VAQYERNCPAFPLFKQSAEVPGCKDKKEKFTLTASKREVRLKRYNVTFCKNEFVNLSIIVQNTTAINGYRISYGVANAATC